MPIASKPIFVVPIDLGTMVCDSADPGHPLSNLNQHKAIGTTWKADATGDHWMRGQFTAEQRIDFCAIIAANADATTQFRLRLGTSQAEVDGTAPYDSGALDFISTAPVADPLDGLYHSHLELPAVEEATWWRIDITGHTGVFEASMVVMGEKARPSRFYNLDTGQGVEDLGEVKIGAWGVLDEEDGIVLRTLEFSLAWLSEVEFETTFRPLMQRLGQRGVVYCCFDPTDSSYRQARTYMGILRKPLAARGRKVPNTYQQDYSLISFI